MVRSAVCKTETMFANREEFLFSSLTSLSTKEFNSNELMYIDGTIQNRNDNTWI